MKLTLAAGLFVAASAAAYAQQTPAGSTGAGTPPASGGQRPQQTASPEQPRAGEQTLTGCLTSADNIYTLTLLDADQPPGSTVPTVSYTLAPGSGVDLRPHVNKKVQVKGTEAGPGMENSQRVVVDSSRPAPTGTSGTAGANDNGRSGSTNNAPNPSRGGSTPTVQTEAKARIVAKTLNVSAVQPAQGSCTETR